MQATQFVSGLVILIAIIFTCDAHVVGPTGRCRNRERCMDKCEDCPWGSISTEECGFEECTKGPGQRCGGRHNMWGICGNGLSCQCNKCEGCSTTSVGRDCYNNVDCISEKFDQWLRSTYYVNA